MKGAIRLLLVIVTVPVALLAIGSVLAPIGHPSAREVFAILAALSLGSAALAWVAWQTGASAVEMVIWALGFRLLCMVIPCDPTGLVVALAASAARFGAPAFRPRPLARPALMFVALAVASGLALHRVDQGRPLGGDTGACYADGSRPVAVLGDSSTYGLGVPHADRFSVALGATNCAFPGAPSRTLSTQLASAGSPETVVIYVGPNDRYLDGWRDTLRANLTAAVRGRRAVLVTYPFGAAIKPAWLLDLNAIVREVAAAEGATLVDAAAVMRDPRDFLVDGVHPSASGHRKLASMIAPFV